MNSATPPESALRRRAETREELYRHLAFMGFLFQATILLALWQGTLTLSV